ncbi:IS3 family transposase [Paenibacillus prosopidis]
MIHDDYQGAAEFERVYKHNHKYQWGLKKMTPVQYRNHLLSVA